MKDVSVGNWSLMAAVLLTGSLFYWYVVCLVTGQNEPWDAGSYWLVWYPVSLGLAAIGGLVLKPRGWIAGAIVTFAQLPVMAMINGELGSLIALGLVLMTFLAVPAAGIAQVAGRLGNRP